MSAVPSPSPSMISTTLFVALGSKTAATQTSATRSRETSPELSVFSLETWSGPVGGLALRPPGRTIV